MKFSILICTCRSQDRISEVILSIKNQTAVNYILEVLFIDYNSDDLTEFIITQEMSKINLPFKFLPFQISGKSAAIEYGLDLVRGDYTLILDDDNILDTNFIEIAQFILRDNEMIGCLGSKGIFDSSLNQPYWFEKYKSNFAIGLPKQNITTDWVWGAASIINNNTWKALRARGFNFQLSPKRISNTTPINLGGEDVELSLAIKLIGYKIDFSDKLIFIHKFNQKRLTTNFLTKNNYGVSRSIIIHDIYRILIIDKSRSLINIKVHLKFFKQIITILLKLITFTITFKSHLDKLMLFTTLKGMLSGYIFFFSKIPSIITSIKKIKYT
jgi:glycosyltransferase involved in cell wall biosynthesis